MLIKTRILYLAIFHLVSAPSGLKKHDALPQKILLACNITTYDVSMKARPYGHHISRKLRKKVDRAEKTRTICDLEILN